MNVCPYCSHDNQHEGPCARCGLEGNPSGTPWGIRKDRNTKYWNKYNWNSQTFTDDYGTKKPITAQERDNKVNHDEIMRVIRPHKRDPKKHKHFTASQPAMYDLTWHSTPRQAVEEAIDDAEQDGVDIDPDNLLNIFEHIFPGLEEMLEGLLSEDEVEEIIKGVVHEKEGVGEVAPDRESDMRGTPYKLIHVPGEKFPIIFYETEEYLPRGIALVELPNGMRIPFYSSAGETPKVDVGIYPGDWTALMGIHERWYNKSEWETRDGTKVNISHWNDPHLKKAKAWLQKKWPVERIKKLKKHQLRTRNERVAHSNFYSQMFLAHYPPLPYTHPRRERMSDEAIEQTKVVLEDLKKDNLYINNKVVKKGSLKPKKKEVKPRIFNNHFGHSASVLVDNGHFDDSNPRKRVWKPKYEATGEVTTLDPTVKAGTVESPACSQCLSIFKAKDYSTFPKHLIFQANEGEDYARCANIVTAMQAIIPAAVEYLSGGKHKIETIALISEDEYRGPTGSMLNREKLERQYPQIPKGNAPYEHINLIKMSKGYPKGAHALFNALNLEKNFSPEEWAVIYFHELGHLFQHSPHWRMYHQFPKTGDKHCAYNCLFHHYESCGNIAVGRELEIFKSFAHAEPHPFGGAIIAPDDPMGWKDSGLEPFRTDPINYKMHTYSAVLSREANDREAREAGAPTPACRRCGHYHDKRLECPNLVYLAPHQRFGYVEPEVNIRETFATPPKYDVPQQQQQHVVVRNPSTQMQKTSTPVQMRPRNTHEYQPTGHAYNKPELLVALDIDDTLVDTSQRMRSAKRMGLFDPKQVGNKQHPKGRQAFLEFFYSSDRFSLDKPIQGAVDYAYSLVQQGYKIAYITGRPDYTYELTKAQLRNLGFPLTNDKYGATLLYCKPEAAKETASWKKNILSSLQNNYDVRFFFDNNPKNLEAARQLNIPGLYLAIDQYTGITALANRFKKVPAHLDNPGHDVSSYRRAAGCIVQRATDKKVLLLRRSPMETSMHGMYELPGGKLEEGETPKQAAKVETKEEAGMEVKIVKELTPVHVDHDMKKCYHCFLARPKKGAKVVLSEEHDHFMWVTPEQALTMKEPLSHHAEHFFRVMTGVKVNSHHIDEDEEAYRDMFDDSPYANPAGVIPIMTGEPTGKHTKLGSVFSEVFIGRNIGADVGEVVQAIYRGIIGGRTSMAEKRMAMAVATMQKELSDKAVELGGNAISNLNLDYEIPKGTASVTLIAHGDAIKTSTVRNNPGGSTATKLYREFNGKAPDKVEKTSIKIPATLVRVGEGGCWSVGYRSDKEGHGENQKYIHEFGDFGRFPKKKPKKGHRKEPDLYAALDEKGNVIDLRIIGGTFSLDIDPDTGINWLVG